MRYRFLCVLLVVAGCSASAKGPFLENSIARPSYMDCDRTGTMCHCHGAAARILRCHQPAGWTGYDATIWGIPMPLFPLDRDSTVHSAQEGMFFDIDALRAPSPAMNVVLTAAQRISTLSGIAWRVVAVDEELGLVLLPLDFGPGSVFGPGERWPHAWEAFEVYGGEIHAAEAFMRGMPANTPSGW